MKPVQYAQVSYFAHFSRLFFLLFRDELIFSFFFFFIYLFYLFFWGGGIFEDFISEMV